MESSYGSLLASTGSGDSSGSGDEEGGPGSNGAARRQEGGTIGSWPFNLGSLVSSLAGGKPSGGDSSSSSVPAPNRNGSLNGSSPNGAGPAAAGAASNGRSSGGGEGAGRESTIDPQVLEVG